MTHSRPSVSVIMPAFNSESYIAEAITSVLDQTMANLELIVIDDGSSDGTVSRVAEFARQDRRLRLITLARNSGAAVARNTGIEACFGKYIAFLDADDLWLPNKLERQLAFLSQSGAKFAFSAYERVNETGQVVKVVHVPARVTYRQLLKNCIIGCLTAIYDAESLGKVQMPLIRKRQDFGMWLQLLRKTPFAAGLDEPLARYRIRPGSISSNKLDAMMYTWRLYREIERLPLPSALWYFSNYAATSGLRNIPGRRRS